MRSHEQKKWVTGIRGQIQTLQHNGSLGSTVIWLEEGKGN